MKINDILKINKSKLINGDNIEINHFVIDIDNIEGNTMFFPLKGKTDYIIDGVNNGLTGFFVEPGHDKIIKEAISINKDIVIIEVRNVLKALQDLARISRENINVPVIALTGSFGKTSQREMLYCVLKEEYKVLMAKYMTKNKIAMLLTLVNYNNEDILLLELGSDHIGEINFLTDICKPNITLVTNIGTGHIGKFRNIKNILKENISISKNSDYFFKNMDDELIRKAKIDNCDVIEYGIFGNDISNIILGKKNRYTVKVDNKRYKVTINSDIEYLINYSICALKIGLLLKMDIMKIIKGIDKYKMAPSRMEKIQNGKYLIIKDCHNASYETMIDGLAYFEKQNQKNKIIVLGDILELGSKSRKIHKAIAKYIYVNNFHFEQIHLVGKEMKRVYNYLNKKGVNVYYYSNVDRVPTDIAKNKSVYFKASHEVGLEKLIPIEK